MGKRGRKLITTALLTGLCVNTVWAQEDRRIEQVNLNMPELVMYANGMTVEEVSGAECYLAQAAARVSATMYFWIFPVPSQIPILKE